MIIDWVLLRVILTLVGYIRYIPLTHKWTDSLEPPVVIEQIGSLKRTR